MSITATTTTSHTRHGVHLDIDGQQVVALPCRGRARCRGNTARASVCPCSLPHIREGGTTGVDRAGGDLGNAHLRVKTGCPGHPLSAHVDSVSHCQGQRWFHQLMPVHVRAQPWHRSAPPWQLEHRRVAAEDRGDHGVVLVIGARYCGATRGLQSAFRAAQPAPGDHFDNHGESRSASR